MTRQSLKSVIQEANQRQEARKVASERGMTLQELAKSNGWSGSVDEFSGVLVCRGSLFVGRFSDQLPGLKENIDARSPEELMVMTELVNTHLETVAAEIDAGMFQPPAAASGADPSTGGDEFHLADDEVIDSEVVSGGLAEEPEEVGDAGAADGGELADSDVIVSTWEEATADSGGEADEMLDQFIAGYGGDELDPSTGLDNLLDGDVDTDAAGSETEQEQSLANDEDDGQVADDLSLDEIVSSGSSVEMGESMPVDDVPDEPLSDLLPDETGVEPAPDQPEQGIGDSLSDDADLLAAMMDDDSDQALVVGEDSESSGSLLADVAAPALDDLLSEEVLPAQSGADDETVAGDSAEEDLLAGLAGLTGELTEDDSGSGSGSMADADDDLLADQQPIAEDDASDNDIDLDAVALEGDGADGPTSGLHSSNGSTFVNDPLDGLLEQAGSAESDLLDDLLTDTGSDSAGLDVGSDSGSDSMNEPDPLDRLLDAVPVDGEGESGGDEGLADLLGDLQDAGGVGDELPAVEGEEPPVDAGEEALPDYLASYLDDDHAAARSAGSPPSGGPLADLDYPADEESPSIDQESGDQMLSATMEELDDDSATASTAEDDDLLAGLDSVLDDEDELVDELDQVPAEADDNAEDGADAALDAMMAGLDGDDESAGSVEELPPDGLAEADAASGSEIIADGLEEEVAGAEADDGLSETIETDDDEEGDLRGDSMPSSGMELDEEAGGMSVDSSDDIVSDMDEELPVSVVRVGTIEDDGPDQLPGVSDLGGGAEVDGGEEVFVIGESWRLQRGEELLFEGERGGLDEVLRRQLMAHGSEGLRLLRVEHREVRRRETIEADVPFSFNVDVRI